MESLISCFSWQNHTSDYLDHSLPEETKRQLDIHLKQCEDCEKRLEHYRVLLNTISTLPKPTLSPHSIILKRVSGIHIPRWDYVPWYIRSLIHGLSIVALVLIGISSVPKIRSIYEKKIEKTLSEFRESAQISEPHDDNNPSIPPTQEHAEDSLNSSERGDEISGEDDSPEDTEDSLPAGKVGKSQLWRFTLKTVTPDELRPQVVKTLIALGVPSQTPGLAGLQVPGGIEFDLVLPQNFVLNIKQELQKLATKSLIKPISSESNIDHQSEEKENNHFSWYRVKSRRKLPEGKSQVVIWLSQPTP